MKFEKCGKPIWAKLVGRFNEFLCKKLLPPICCCCCESSREEIRGHQPDSPHSRLGDRQVPRAPRRNKNEEPDEEGAGN